MEELNKVLSELGISKVRLAKYLGVSRQMLYNYWWLRCIMNKKLVKIVTIILLLAMAAGTISLLINALLQ